MKKMKQALSFMAAALLLTTSLYGCSGSATQETTAAASSEEAKASETASEGAKETAKTEGGAYKIAVVPKMTNIAWFQRMEEGVKQYNDENGTDVFYGGSSEGADQAAYVEALLAEDWDAICVVPFDSEALAPVLEKAKAQGIVVITHEAASMDAKVRDYDIEAFLNKDYGENFMKQMAELSGGKGKYIQFVGSLTSVSHNEWCDAAKALQEKEYPDMEFVGRYETADDTTSSYNQTKELLAANPDIVLIQGSASTDIVGAAQAVSELGLSKKVHIVGTSLASISGQFIEEGVISSFSVWDPAEAGKAMIELANAALAGEVNADLSLKAKGYESLTEVDGVFYGNARVDVNKENMADFDF